MPKPPDLAAHTAPALAPHPRRLRSRRRRLLVGLGVSAATALLLALVLELAARVLVPAAVLSPFQPIYRKEPVAGFVLQPGWRGYSLGANLQINSLGYRGPEWGPTKAPESIRIALIGDSHAFGFGVEFEDTVGEVLARTLSARLGRPCEVMNFGMPAYNLQQELAVLERKALPLAPDLVVVLPCDNDHDHALWADDEGYLHWAPADEHPPERTRMNAEPLVSTPGSWFLRRSRAYLYVKLLWSRIQLRRQIERVAPPTEDAKWQQPLPPAPPPEHLRQPVWEPLTAMRRLCDERGVPLVVAAFSSTDAYRTLMAAFARETGTPVVELLQLFPEAKSWGDLLAKFSLGWDSHLGPEAHRRWGHAVAERILADRLLEK